MAKHNSEPESLITFMLSNPEGLLNLVLNTETLGLYHTSQAL